jgi:hypothetical protein
LKVSVNMPLSHYLSISLSLYLTLSLSLSLSLILSLSFTQTHFFTLSVLPISTCIEGFC